MTSRTVNSYERSKSVASEDVDIVNRVTPAAEASAPGGIEIDTDLSARRDRDRHRSCHPRRPA